MKHKLLGILMFVLFSFFLIGCPSVNLIHGVAKQNQRNSQALQKNIEWYFSEIKPLLIGALETKLSERYRQVGESVIDESKRARNYSNGYQEYFTNKSNTLRANIEGLKSPEAQQKEKDVLRLLEPLAAAVAFDNLSKEKAANTAELYIAIVLWNLDGYEKQIIRYSRLKTLKPIKDWERAKSDIVDSIKTIQETIIMQATMSTTIADQLKNASETSKDPSAFLKGIAENNELYTAIANVVSNNTKNKNRGEAAKKLLDSLKEEKNTE